MSIFDRVRDALRIPAPLSTGPDGEPVDAEVVAATATLLLAAAHGDREFVRAEQQAIEKGLGAAFGISRDQAFAILAAAEKAGLPDVDLKTTAGAIRGAFDTPQCERILGLLWGVVYADQIVDTAEVALAREVTSLLGLTEEQSQRARDKAFQWFSRSRSSE